MSSQTFPESRPSRTGRTRVALIAAGLDLMVDRPIDAIPIDDFVARAGVAKGSFFNHFKDKHDFAAAVAAEVRLEVEAEVARANAGVSDPVARIAGGMAVAARFAVEQPRRAMVLLRSQVPATNQSHPLNRGLSDDIEAALEQGLLQPEARQSGVLYWLGLCQVLMMHLVETRPSRQVAADRLGDMLLMGLTGLGAPAAHVEELVCAARTQHEGMASIPARPVVAKR
ncbi:TetR/AcrR family transcriptional regulator [Sphingomonas ursincola]|uniref:TetR/AcrR family transcriptional regulator n=1 Tax=Sphingomonas ursincola TaxID=56361 RepID=A0A7V8RGE0_9SPHN|nr:TetR/AcrR family transcriptional regulator [Sphingomonas ursincola]MBA1375972.1 TetR/AcrR family transcriptional regulator [Sphingomonas ursincola]